MSYFEPRLAVIAAVVISSGCKSKVPPDAHPAMNEVPPAAAGPTTSPTGDPSDPALAIPAVRKALVEKKFDLALAMGNGVKGRLGPTRASEIDPLLKEINEAIAAYAKAEDLALEKVPPRALGDATAELKIKVLRSAVGKDVRSNSFGTGDTTTSAERGNVLVSFDVDVTSTNKHPLLPCFLVATRKRGAATLKVQGQLGYGFRRWDNYASYLGNNPDRGNDFAMSDTVKFVMLGEFPKELPNTEAIYLLAEKGASMIRKENRFGKPPVSYEGTCKYASEATRSEFEEKFFVIDWRKPGS